MFPTVKVVVVGPPGVGKTSLVDRAAKGIFRTSPPETDSILVTEKILKDATGGGNSIAAQFWDCASTSLDSGRKPDFYNDAKAALLLYDITDSASFERCTTEVYKEVQRYLPDAFYMLIGTKRDMEDSRRVPLTEAQRFAAGRDIVLMDVSAKDGTNIDLAMSILRIRAVATLQVSDRVQAHQVSHGPLKAEDPGTAQHGRTEEEHISPLTIADLLKQSGINRRQPSGSEQESSWASKARTATNGTHHLEGSYQASNPREQEPSLSLQRPSLGREAPAPYSAVNPMTSFGEEDAEGMSLRPVSRSYNTISAILGRGSGAESQEPTNIKRLAARLLHMSDLAAAAAYGENPTTSRSSLASVGDQTPAVSSPYPFPSITAPEAPWTPQTSLGIESRAKRASVGRAPAPALRRREETDEEKSFANTVEEGEEAGGVVRAARATAADERTSASDDIGYVPDVSNEYEHLKSLLEAATRNPAVASIELGEEPMGSGREGQEGWRDRGGAGVAEDDVWFGRSAAVRSRSRSPSPHRRLQDVGGGSSASDEQFQSSFLRRANGWTDAADRRVHQHVSPQSQFRPRSRSPSPPPSRSSPAHSATRSPPPSTGRAADEPERFLLRFERESPEPRHARPAARRHPSAPAEEEEGGDDDHQTANYLRRRVLMFIDVKVKDGLVGQIVVKRGDNFYSLAHKFVREHKLGVSNIVKLSRMIEDRVTRWKELQKKREEQAKREESMREMLKWKNRHTTPQPFSFATESRKKLQAHGSDAESQANLIGRLVVEMGPGRTAVIPLREGDRAQDLMHTFTLAYRVSDEQARSIYRELQRRLATSEQRPPSPHQPSGWLRRSTSGTDLTLTSSVDHLVPSLEESVEQKPRAKRAQSPLPVRWVPEQGGMPGDPTYSTRVPDGRESVSTPARPPQQPGSFLISPSPAWARDSDRGYNRGMNGTGGEEGPQAYRAPSAASEPSPSSFVEQSFAREPSTHAHGTQPQQRQAQDLPISSRSTISAAAPSTGVGTAPVLGQRRPPSTPASTRSGQGAFSGIGRHKEHARSRGEDPRAGPLSTPHQPRQSQVQRRSFSMVSEPSSESPHPQHPTTAWPSSPARQPAPVRQHGRQVPPSIEAAIASSPRAPLGRDEETDTDEDAAGQSDTPHSLNEKQRSLLEATLAPRRVEGESKSQSAPFPAPDLSFPPQGVRAAPAPSPPRQGARAPFTSEDDVSEVSEPGRDGGITSFPSVAAAKTEALSTTGSQPLARMPRNTPQRRPRRHKGPPRELSAVHRRQLEASGSEAEGEGNAFQGDESVAASSMRLKRVPSAVLTESDTEKDAVVLEDGPAEREVAFRLDVQISDSSEPQRIVVCRGDSITALAEAFAKKHNLPAAKLSKLKRLLRKNIQKHLSHHGEGVRTFR